ncbi:hypothetical protein SLEP1_g22387 [Rubroshorea leprosula]|uniref:Uncharacterized protein n=1 Tax=Rubroshorea leprosula TaxID=152421 RepID=A0AAV5JIA4_9ROSI|nr:hypothetical protein SLEP1_g22387 [Rubroshorea leprosula]
MLVENAVVSDLFTGIIIAEVIFALLQLWQETTEQGLNQVSHIRKHVWLHENSCFEIGDAFVLFLVSIVVRWRKARKMSCEGLERAADGGG